MRSQACTNPKKTEEWRKMNTKCTHKKNFLREWTMWRIKVKHNHRLKNLLKMCKYLCFFISLIFIILSDQFSFSFIGIYILRCSLYSPLLRIRCYVSVFFFSHSFCFSFILNTIFFLDITAVSLLFVTKHTKCEILTKSFCIFLWFSSERFVFCCCCWYFIHKPAYELQWIGMKHKCKRKNVHSAHQYLFWTYWLVKKRWTKNIRIPHCEREKKTHTFIHRRN